MTAPRRLLLAVLLCCAATAGVAACTPIDEDPTLAMASDDVEDPEDAEFAGEVGDAGDTGDVGDAGGLAEEEYGDSPDADAEPGLDAAPPTPCATHAVRRTVQVLDVVDGRLTLRPACAPEADPSSHALAAHATATLVDLPHDEPAKEVQLPLLLDHLDACLTDGAPEPPYACYGNTYDVVLDSRGRITRIRELQRP
ncbi:hypothetical protein GCM10009639_46810 [Kitasatospora putterlickiae]|uniref:Lipoprotein n=1 Tax=Kitasatospora putterlickiae TaxID=221725 RepID=A0ABN1YBW9_9ACTN